MGPWIYVVIREGKTSMNERIDEERERWRDRLMEIGERLPFNI